MKIASDVSVYRTIRNGGRTIDKRTIEGKDLVDRIKEHHLMKEVEKDRISYDYGVNKKFLTLRMKDLDILLNTADLILN